MIVLLEGQDFNLPGMFSVGSQLAGTWERLLQPVNKKLFLNVTFHKLEICRSF